MKDFLFSVSCLLYVVLCLVVMPFLVVSGVRGIIHAYDKAYEMLKGRMLKEIRNTAVSKKEQEYAQKVKAKADAIVLSVSPTKQIEDKPIRPAIKDCKSTPEP